MDHRNVEFHYRYAICRRWSSGLDQRSRREGLYLFMGSSESCVIIGVSRHRDPLDRKLSRKMVERWILFARGVDPWVSRQPDGYDMSVTESGLEEATLYSRSE